MSTLVQAVRPGLLFGEQPSRASTPQSLPADRIVFDTLKGWANPIRAFAGFQPVLKRIITEQQRLELLDSEAFNQTIENSRKKLRTQPLDDIVVVQLFAAIRVATRRIHHITLHAEQLFAAWAMLHGNIVEMSTGEGKTLSAALPAIVVALTRTPVHIITVNEYLVDRDVNLLSPLFECFGLTASGVTDALSDDDRRKAYQANIVYATNKQIVFDYLRDQQLLGSEHSGLKSQIRTLLSAEPVMPVMQGLCYAIVDEADSVMIDDARIPLILAEPQKTARSTVTQSTVALGISRTLHEGADFKLQLDTRSVWLTETGLDAVCRLADRLGGVWKYERYRNELIRQALCALHLYQRDRDYLVDEGRVELIDESTGRTMPDRKLQHGLHRMLELKEGCLPSDENLVKSTISFQSFFSRYHHLTGMSGTVHEVRSELMQIYGKPVIRIPLHKKSLRRCLPTIVLPDRTRQMARALEEVRRHAASGQPLLIGTRTVEMSEQFSKLLDSHGLAHALLNARQDSDESGLIARAGRPGSITVATNMAGRGTDIPLQANAAALGGLHVINLDINESARIDRQLFGRAARQGDPGSCQSILNLQDEMVDKYSLRLLSNLADKSVSGCPRLGHWLALVLIKHAQRRCEHVHAQQRIAVFRGKDKLRRKLAIGGRES